VAGSRGARNRPWMELRWCRAPLGAARRAGRRTKGRRGPVAACSLAAGMELPSQPGGRRLDAPPKALWEQIEFRHDVVAYHLGALVRRHRIELLGRDHPRRVSHGTRLPVDGDGTKGLRRRVPALGKGCPSGRRHQGKRGRRRVCAARSIDAKRLISAGTPLPARPPSRPARERHLPRAP